MQQQCIFPLTHRSNPIISWRLHCTILSWEGTLLSDCRQLPVSIQAAETLSPLKMKLKTFPEICLSYAVVGPGPRRLPMMHWTCLLHSLSTACVHAPLLHVIKICLLSPTLSVLACLSMLSFFLFLLGFLSYSAGFLLYNIKCLEITIALIWGYEHKQNWTELNFQALCLALLRFNVLFYQKYNYDNYVFDYAIVKVMVWCGTLIVWSVILL